MTDISKTVVEYRIPPEIKLKHLGEGEWVAESDYISFEYKGYKAKVSRAFAKEPYAFDVCFGGHLCGYVKIPEDHTLYKKDYTEIDLDVHGGLTWSEQEIDGYWIGFDCAHYMDLIPSSEQFRKNNAEMQKLKKRFPDMFVLNPKYRNIEFCIGQCKSMIDQLIEVYEKR